MENIYPQDRETCLPLKRELPIYIPWLSEHYLVSSGGKAMLSQFGKYSDILKKNTPILLEINKACADFRPIQSFDEFK